MARCPIIVRSSDAGYIEQVGVGHYKVWRHTGTHAELASDICYPDDIAKALERAEERFALIERLTVTTPGRAL